MNDLKRFLEEDIGRGDITSSIIPDIPIGAVIICKEDAIIAGLQYAIEIFRLVKCEAKMLLDEGSKVSRNTEIMYIKGNARSILSAERTALNLLMRMSGIATMTRRLIDKVRDVNPKVRIACTRKTAPGLRAFDKLAVSIAGGETHRMRLDDMILIKDNHLALIGSVEKAVKTAREIYGNKYRIEVEVESLEDAEGAVKAGADMIMLDNRTPEEVYFITNMLKERGLRDAVTIEVSGGITFENIIAYAKADIDMISLGSITHSVKSIDMSLEIRS